MARKAKWTVLTYIAAHNNLDALGQRSLKEILRVGSTTEVVHGALYDGPEAAGRYVMGEPDFVAHQEQLGRIDSGDPDQLIATARWLFDAYPAERYGLVLWSHGTGWEPSEVESIAREARPITPADASESRERAAAPGSISLFRTTLRTMLSAEKRAERAILFDDGTGHSLDTLELARVTTTIAQAIEQPLDLLGMDACLMASLEVAYELRKSVSYLAASQELVPGHSWPYDTILAALRAHPEMGGADLARLVVDHYVRFYTAHPPGAGDVTKVALDLGRIADLSREIGRLSDALRTDMSTQADLLWQVQRATQQKETRNGQRTPSKFDYHLWDVGSLAAGLAAAAGASAGVQQSAARVDQALAPGAGVVLAEGHRGTWFDGTGGVSAYLMPPGQQRVAPSYGKLAFAADTRWGDMVSAYHERLE
jgi:hypothetical protein